MTFLYNQCTGAPSGHSSLEQEPVKALSPKGYRGTISLFCSRFLAPYAEQQYCKQILTVDNLEMGNGHRTVSSGYISYRLFCIGQNDIYNAVHYNCRSGIPYGNLPKTWSTRNLIFTWQSCNLDTNFDVRQVHFTSSSKWVSWN